MNTLDSQYKELLADILWNGHEEKNSRTGVGTKAVFGRQLRFKMQEGFPLLTTKKMFHKGIIHELLWFLGNHLNGDKYKRFGRTNAKYLIDNGVNIWVGDLYKKYVKEYELENAKSGKNRNNETLDYLRDNGKEILVNNFQEMSALSINEFIEKIKTDDKFAIKNAECGPIYGKQWTRWDAGQYSIDQIDTAIQRLKETPTDRRIMVSAWNVADIMRGHMVLPPCHYGFTFFTRLLTLEERIDMTGNSIGFDVMDFGMGMPDEHAHDVCDQYGIPRRALSLKWNQRSVDTALGLPFNIASYGLLLELIAREVKMMPEDLIASLENTHVYLNQITGVQEHLSREVKHELPKLQVNPLKTIFNLTYEDIQILDYESYPKIDIPLSN